MTNRREFLQIGIAAGGWPIASRAARAAGADAYDSTVVPLYKVVYDKRFDDSVAFAGRMEVLGLPVHAIEGDVTRFWYHELFHQWRKEPSAIAGLTAHGPLFCLERLAWDQGMRVVFRAEHRFASDGCIEHELTGPPTMLHESLGVKDAPAQWSLRMADVATRCPRRRSETSNTRFTVSPTFSSHHGESLYSWVIAPASDG